ncbi:MAG: hypothetical protein IT337_06925 [Thermomicrobiales bacterium]|nr:hypothetical protein [Thermomicrobiales bacterium]
MARLARLAIAGAVLANGVLAVGQPVQPADAAMAGALPLIQNQRTQPADTEPLDADLGTTASTSPTGADEEDLDREPRTSATAGGTDVEPLDQGAPPAAPAAAEPVSAAAPAAAAPLASEPVQSGETSAPAEPTTAGLGWPFNKKEGGGVFVNAGFGPGEASSGQGVQTCSVRAVNGRAYSGSGCSGADVVAGFTKEAGIAVSDVAATGKTDIGDLAAMGIADVIPNLDNTSSTEAPPSSRSTPSGSGARNSDRTTVSRTPGSISNPNDDAIIVTGPSQTTTRTTTRNEDGTTVTDTAQGAKNQTKTPKSDKASNDENAGKKNGNGKKRHNKKQSKKQNKKHHKNNKNNKKRGKNKKQQKNKQRKASGERSLTGKSNMANTSRARKAADKHLPPGCRTDARTRPDNPPGCKE